MPISEDRTIPPAFAEVVQKQRQEILCKLEEVKQRKAEYQVIEAYNPTIEKYAHIKAITYDGVSYQGKKTKVFAYLGFPEGATPDAKVPAVVLVHGGCGHPFLEWVRIWNERGYAAIAMETTGYFPEKVNAGVNESGFLYDFGSFAREGYVLAPQCGNATEYTEVENQWPYHGISQVILAGNILRQDKRVDSRKVGIMGISWGGILTTQTIGFDSRFAFAIPVYGTAYLTDERCPFGNFDNPYVAKLWAAEQNLDNATLPIFWYVLNDDGGFGIPSFVRSYLHTEPLSEKNVLFMRGDWGHSHAHVFNEKETENHSKVFADWVLKGTGGFPTFVTQPEGRNFCAKLTIPEGVTGEISATIHYLTEPMTYSINHKFGENNPNYCLDQTWYKTKENILVDKAAGTVTGTIPETAAGYYIDLEFTVDGVDCVSSSIYIEVV